MSFTPLAGNSYVGKIVLPNGIVITQALPPSYDNGYVMRVDENAQQITVTVKRKKMPGEPDSGEILLAAHTRQILKVVHKSFINTNDSALFTIDKEKLGKGVTHLTVFSINNKPVCERLVYLKPDKDANLSITGNMKEYNNRKEIALSLNLSGNQVSQSSFNLSASVFYLDSLQKENSSNIFNYMWLTSDLDGEIENPGYYFSNEPDVSKATDNLMLTFGWRRFNWGQVLEAVAFM